MSLRLWLCKKLYKLALKIVEVVVKDHNENYKKLDEYLDNCEYLSYKGWYQTLLNYGVEQQWSKISMNTKSI